jgi:hypothetical protein
MSVLKQHYGVSEDWTGSKYCSLHIDWDYINRTCTCDISMPEYDKRVLACASNMLRPRAHKMHLMPGLAPNMAPKSNFQRSMAQALLDGRTRQ